MCVGERAGDIQLAEKFTAHIPATVSPVWQNLEESLQASEVLSGQVTSIRKDDSTFRWIQAIALNYIGVTLESFFCFCRLDDTLIGSIYILYKKLCKCQIILQINEPSFLFYQQ